MIYVSFHALYASDSLDVVVTLPAAGNVETGSGCVVMGHMEWTRTFTLNTNASLEQSQRPCKPRIIEVTKCDGETNTVTDDTMHCSSLGSTRFLVSVYTCGVLLIYINYMQQSRDWPHSVTDKLPASEPLAAPHSLHHLVPGVPGGLSARRVSQQLPLEHASIICLPWLPVYLRDWVCLASLLFSV